MAKKWLLGLMGKEKDDSGEVIDVLARNRTPIHVEIEQSMIRFKSQLTVKNNTIVIAKPLTLGSELKSGNHVRIRWPGAGRREMRLLVMLPHINLPNGNAGFACKAPDGTAMPKRKQERYDVSRFNNLKLKVGATSYRVLDLSIDGMRIAMTTNMNGSVTLGKEVQEAILMVGEDSRILFERLVPRSNRRGAIGVEFSVKQDGKSPRKLADVLKSVQSKQLDFN
jgi:hypothetical protein